MPYKNSLILIVDDSKTHIRIIERILDGFEFKFGSVHSGFEALEYLENNSPDLILLDVEMVDMNGYETCKKIKENPKNINIPVIFLTVKSETLDIINGLEAGGVDYVIKPCKAEELNSRIKTHIELKRSRDLIILQNEKLIQLNKEKNEFLGIATHDLKNPLNTIQGWADVLHDNLDNFSFNEIKENLKLISQASRKMFDIIISLLDINSIEEGRINLELKEFDLNSVISSVNENYKLKLLEKNIKMHIQYEKEHVFVTSDLMKCEQIIDNLVSNAIKYSEFNKNIFINSKTYINKMTNEVSAIIEIQDEGPGLTEKDKENLFKKFSKLSARPTNNENSTGLGLSIVKRLAEMIGGDIWCESEKGKGAKFIFKLNLSK